ncbi:hypothetical protein NL676_007199 [Syzygium grande]|nr:hypothetical protein NL676_007199 [Syzygium grande]
MAPQNISANDQNRKNTGLMPVLPPGFCFFPSDEEIFRYYLVNKNNCTNPDPPIVTVKTSDERQRRMRTVSDGFWLMRGRGNNAIVGGGGEVLGSKSCFVFYMGTSVHNAVRTDWTMHEFALPDHAQASFVLYRLFAKPWTGNSSSSARNDGMLTYEAAPGGNREDRTTGNAVRLVTEIHDHVPVGCMP